MKKDRKGMVKDFSRRLKDDRWRSKLVNEGRVIERQLA